MIIVYLNFFPSRSWRAAPLPSAPSQTRFGRSRGRYQVFATQHVIVIFEKRKVYKGQLRGEKNVWTQEVGGLLLLTRRSCRSIDLPLTRKVLLLRCFLKDNLASKKKFSVAVTRETASVSCQFSEKTQLSREQLPRRRRRHLHQSEVTVLAEMFSITYWRWDHWTLVSNQLLYSARSFETISFLFKLYAVCAVMRNFRH